MGLKIKSSVNVYIVREGKLLLSRRRNTGWLDGHLCAPGGHVEKGETPTQAIVREIKEELGADVKPSDLEFLCVAQRNTKPDEYVAYEFVLKNSDFDITNAEPEKCSELIWVEPTNLPSDVIDDFGQIIKQALVGGKKYIEVGY